MIAGSNLENVLRSGTFAVTGELGPPKNADLEVVRNKARILKGYVDAVNITDCQTAIVRMSSLAGGLIALSEGLEPVIQMTCRDRNRIGMQADILGAASLGIRNLLCLTGDHQKFGNHPQAKGVFDMDSIQLLQMVKGMRDDRIFQCGEEIKTAEPRLFLGCAANPFADPFEFRPVRLAKKVEAGANFVQTQIIYNVEKFRKFMEMVCDLGVHEKCYILAGVTPPKSLGMARYMKKFVAGMDVTDEVISRLQDAKDQREEGINICVDIINQVKEIPGVAGIHIMAIEWEEAVPEIVKRAGLEERPVPKGISPALIGVDSIEEAVEMARQEARAELESDLEKARAEAQASRELVVKEKEKIATEISGLKKQVEEAREMASRKEAEINELTRKLMEARKALEQKQQTGTVPAAQTASATVVESVGTVVTDAPLTPREQQVLNSLNLGLQALRQVLGLDEAQFEALRRFLEAEFMLQFAMGGLGAAPVRSQAVSQPEPGPSAPVSETMPATPSEPVEEAVQPDETPARSKELVNLVAKGNVALHSKDYQAAVDAFRKALEMDASDEAAREGLAKAEAAISQAGVSVEKTPAAPAAGEDLLPPMPEGYTEGEEAWREKWIIRYTARGNVALMKQDYEAAKAEFQKALQLDPEYEKAKDGLRRAEAKEGIYLPDIKAEGTQVEAAPAESAKKEPEPGPAAEKEVSEPEVEAKEGPEAKPEVKPEAKPEAKKEEPKASEPKPAGKKTAAPLVSGPAGEGIDAIETPELVKDEPPLAERLGSIPEDVFMEPCSGQIQEVTVGDGDKAIVVGGENTLPFHTFEGDMKNAPMTAFEVLDSEPEEWPDVLAKYYQDVFSDPAAWAQKCVNEFGARAICLSLISTDPNGANVSSSDAAQLAKKVADAVDVPLILWGCGNAEKDTETLREVSALLESRNVCMGPLTDANYRTLGATAMAFGYSVVASTPIDVNLAKQLNILLENLGVNLDHILMDPSVGPVGYGLEYTYSVMERIRLAALTQQDDKLSCPFIINLGREVWKAKETKLPSSAELGDQERRGVLMEAITASSLLLAGGELMVMRHPKSVTLTEALVQGLM